MSAEVDAYFATLPPAFNAVLQALREFLKARLPDHLEVISYAMPGFRQPGPKGRMVAGYASFRHHCGYYPHSGSIVPQFAVETAGFKTSKSGVLFTPEHPLPDELVMKLLNERITEITR